MADPLIGQNLGSYRITRLIKRTGMSMVYLARDDKLDRDVVAKVMLPSHADDEGFAARFHQEALATARLAHPNIIHIYDFGRCDDLYYMVMEYLPGGSLYDRLMEASRTNKRLDMTQALHIVDLMAQALDYAHRAGFVHRDVKPSNILFSQDGHPVLTDLGIVKAREGPQLTVSQAAVGTPEYMSPEQGRGGMVDARSDIYSLGVVLYELLAGKLPFQAETTWGMIYKHMHETPPPLQTLNRSVSPALLSVVEKALAKRPEDRFETAREFAEALKRTQAAPGRRLFPPPPPPPKPDPSEFAEEIAAGKARPKSRPIKRRTDIAALPGRVTPRPAPGPKPSPFRWILGIVAALLVVAAVLVISGAINLDGLRGATPQAIELIAAAPLPDATVMPKATSTSTTRPAKPSATRPPAATRGGISIARSGETAQVVKPGLLPTVVLPFSGGQVALAPYLDPEGKYGLYVPAEWSRMADNLGISFEAPDRMARIMVHQMPDAQPGESAAAIAKRYLTNATSAAVALFQGVREIKSAPAVVGELSAFDQELEANLQGVPIKVRLLAVNTGETGIVAVTAAAAASEPAYRALLVAALESYRVPGSLVEPVKQIAAVTTAYSQPPTVVPTFTQVPRPTVAPTFTQAPRPTVAPAFTRAPQATPVPAAGSRPAVRQTATATARVATSAANLPAPVLLSPADNEGSSGLTTFSWRWDGPALAANQGFEVRIWKASQSIHYGAAEPTNNTSLSINVPMTYGAQQGGSGGYFWTVAVVQRSPYRQIGPEATPRQLQIAVGGGGGGGSATHEPPPP